MPPKFNGGSGLGRYFGKVVSALLYSAAMFRVSSCCATSILANRTTDTEEAVMHSVISPT